MRGIVKSPIIIHNWIPRRGENGAEYLKTAKNLPKLMEDIIPQFQKVQEP